MPCDNKATSETPERPNVLVNYWIINLKTQKVFCQKDSAGEKSLDGQIRGLENVACKKYQLFDSVL